MSPDVVKFSTNYTKYGGHFLAAVFFVQIREKFSTFSTVKTVETLVKTVEWLINSPGFSTETLKIHLKPLID